MLATTVLGSNSSGNCYLVQSPLTKEVLMLDAGVSFKEIQKALKYDFKNLIGVLITHEHTDHIKSAEKLASNGIDLYATRGTFTSKKMEGHRLNYIEALKEFKIGNFKVLPFRTEHDAEDPVGFLIEFMPTKERLLYATDTFYIKYRFKNINYFLIECNYIKEIAKRNIELGIIERTRYKRLVHSHLSLDNCVEFLKNNVSTITRKIVLIHLSDDNSNEEIMKNTIFRTFGIDTVVSRNGETIELKEYPF